MRTPIPTCNPIWLDVAKSNFTQVKRAQGGRRKFPIGNYGIIGVKNKFCLKDLRWCFTPSQLFSQLLITFSPLQLFSAHLNSSQLCAQLQQKLAQLQKTVEVHTHTQPHDQGTLMRPRHCHLQTPNCKRQKSAQWQQKLLLQNCISAPRHKEYDLEGVYKTIFTREISRQKEKAHPNISPSQPWWSL